MITNNRKGDEYGDLNSPWRVEVFDLRFWQPDSNQTRQVKQWILLGETAREADALSSEATVVFMHPRGQPPQRWAGRGTVIFNGVDEEGAREYWIQWANRRKLRIVTVPGVGLDARVAWPTAYEANFDPIK